jgi:hypothetical protein
MASVQGRISDGRILELIRAYLKQDVISDLSRDTLHNQFMRDVIKRYANLIPLSTTRQKTT